MNDVCVNVAFAERAAYAVPNRGTGPSVHLARELARLWGNVQYGVHELHRDDIEGVSEIVAFAWDVQANTRSSRTFIVPHAKSLKTGGRKKLTDLNDEYLNNQNIGARAVRECIFTVLPDWFISDAQQLCEQTRRKGEGVPLRKRIDTTIAAFRVLKVTDAMLEDRIGKPAAQWDEADVADLNVLGRSIKAGDTTLNEEFEPRHKPVTASELTGAPAHGEEIADPWTGEMVDEGAVIIEDGAVA